VDPQIATPLSLSRDASRPLTAASDPLASLVQNRRLVRTCYVVAVGLLGLLLYKNEQYQSIGSLRTIIGIVLYGLAMAPILLWLKNRDHLFPLFPIYALAALPAEAMPFIGGHEGLDTYSEEVVLFAGWCACLHLGGAWIGYHATRAMPRRGAIWLDEIITVRSINVLITGFVLSVFYIFLTEFYFAVPSGWESILRAAVSGIMMVTTYVLARFWSLEQLNRHQKAIIVATLCLLFVEGTATLFLIDAASGIALFLLGYCSTGKRIPWLLIAAISTVFGILHNGKSTMRERYWTEQVGAHVEVSALPAFYTEWVTTSYEESQQSTNKSASLKLFERASLMHMLCMVIDRTPDQQPYLAGQSYEDLPMQFIPRLFWPEKPRGHVSTYLLSMYYGLQTEEGTHNTTIGFGMLAESYANFGWLGCLTLGLVFGCGLKLVTVWTRYSPLLSVPGVLMVVLTKWMLETGQTLSVWTSSLFQACVCIGFLAITLRKFLHG
jgi:hypothetical protein